VECVVPTAQSRSILVVEDEFLLAMEMEAILTDQGFVVIGPAATVAGALDLLEREHPDAAVLDVNLQGIAVTPVARALREMNIPFVLASAYRRSDLPVDDVLRDAVKVGKPVKTAELIEILRRLIDFGA
jgi:DNA-binding response OmpR family regulator